MTSVTLALDNDVTEQCAAGEHISKLFPKCRPRGACASDINLNPIGGACRNAAPGAGADHDQQQLLLLAHRHHHQQQPPPPPPNDNHHLHQQHHLHRSQPTAAGTVAPLVVMSAGVDRENRENDRIIEIAGGREIYSQSRAKAARKATRAAAALALSGGGDELLVEKQQQSRKSQKSPARGVWELRGAGGRCNNEAKKSRSATGGSAGGVGGGGGGAGGGSGIGGREFTETVFASEVCSVTHDATATTNTNTNHTTPLLQHAIISNSATHNLNANVSPDDCSKQLLSSPTKTAKAMDVVVFDDIGESWHDEDGKQPPGGGEHQMDAATAERVTKVIGNLPIAVYEGSPRRYGPRHVESNCTHPPLPSAQSLLASPSVYPPRPGFPQRVVCSPSENDAPTSLADNYNRSGSKPGSPRTTSSTFDYLYEFSETRKVLEEFFKCPPPEEESSRLEAEFQDLEYELRRQASGDSGNSYVGQRLAKGRPDAAAAAALAQSAADFCLRIDSPRKHNSSNLLTLQDHEITEYENNFLDLSIGTGSSGDLGETEVGLQVGHSRNFTLSPETTDCDSNCGDLDSEVSLMLMENELGPASGLLGSSGDLAVPNDSLRLYSSMPVLEDGLSSGHASDTDNNNPTVMLMKRQITEIEREINQGIKGKQQLQQQQLNNKTVSQENGLSPAKECVGVTPIEVINGLNAYDELNHQTDSSDKTPPPPAPAPHRCGPTVTPTTVVVSGGGEPNDVEAAIKDIRLTLQRTKTLPLKCHPEEAECDESAVSPVWVPRQRGLSTTSADSDRKAQSGEEGGDEEEADTDLETDRLLGQQRTDDQGFYDDKGWRKPKSRTIMPPISLSTPKQMHSLVDEGTILPLVASPDTLLNSQPASPIGGGGGGGADHDDDDDDDDDSDKSQSPQSQKGSNSSSLKMKKDKENKKKGRNKEGGFLDPTVLIEGVLFRARYLGSTQLVCEGQPTKTTRMMQAEEAVSRIKEASNQMLQNYGPSSPDSSFDDDDDDDDTPPLEEADEPESESIVDTPEQPIRQVDPPMPLAVVGGGVCGGGGGDGVVGATGTVFRLHFLGSVEVDEEGGRKRRKRLKKNMVELAVTKIKAPDGETQPSTEVDLFISTEKIMVLNTDLKEIMMDHALRTISYIADIGDLVVLMARRRFVPHEMEEAPKINRTPKMICHVFESEEAQFIAQSIGQAFQVAYMEFLKANGIEDHSFVKEMDYQEVLNSQEIFGDELQMFAKKEMQKEVVVPKAKGEILGVVIVESGWGSMLPTVVIANLAPAGAAARCGQLNIGDQIIAINGVSLVGLPLSTCQNYIKNSKNQTVVKLTVVPCAPVVEVKIKRPDTKYQLGFSVQNGVICSLLRGGIAERGGVRVGHRIIEINNQSVVAVPHEKIVNLLATSVGEILMKTMPTSMFRLLTGQENPVYI